MTPLSTGRYAFLGAAGELLDGGVTVERLDCA
jgi:hypothetical protein